MIRKGLPLILAMVMVLAFTATAYAQDAPPVVVEQALADLSTRVGHTVTLADIWQWRWVGDVYPDTSLGCPQPGEQYAQVMTNGFQFMLTYQNTTYDYRVSVDGTIVILCETFAAGTAPQPAVPVDPVPSAPAPVDPVPGIGLTCPELLPPRLEIDEEARVNPDIIRLNVRSGPSLTSPVVNQLTGGSIVTVLEGHECGPEEIAWWQVEFDNFAGWVAEGRGSVYFLEPLTLVPSPVEPTTPDETVSCLELLPTRLEVDMTAQLRPVFGQLNVRSGPALTHPVINQVSSGQVFTVTGGPECGPQNLTWWQVAYDATTGWVAEGRNNVYFLQPLTVEDDQ
jgi:uncharacterized protein YraI